MLEAITVHGKAGHSSDPSLGANAIEGMYAVLGELLALRDELKARHRNPAFRVDYPTLNLGSIHGGDNPNRICGRCETHIDLRPLPGMDLEALRHTLEDRLVPRLAAYPGLSLSFRRLFEGFHRSKPRPRRKSSAPPRNSPEPLPAPWRSAPRRPSSAVWAWKR